MRARDGKTHSHFFSRREQVVDDRPHVWKGGAQIGDELLHSVWPLQIAIWQVMDVMAREQHICRPKITLGIP